MQARRRASQPAAGSHLPRLFSLDSQLGMPRGFGYRIIGGLVACSTLDDFGNPEGRVDYPREMTPYALYLEGLVSETEYREAARSARDPACDDGDGVCGDGDGAGGDSGGACGGCGGS